MGHKILDVKADIREDIKKYFRIFIGRAKTAQLNDGRDGMSNRSIELFQIMRENVLGIVDEHFEKIER
jgi:hypothetical protein